MEKALRNLKIAKLINYLSFWLNLSLSLYNANVHNAQWLVVLELIICAINLFIINKMSVLIKEIENE